MSSGGEFQQGAAGGEPLRLTRKQRRLAMREVRYAVQKSGGDKALGSEILRSRLPHHKAQFGISEILFAAFMQWAIAQLIKWLQDELIDDDAKKYGVYVGEELPGEDDGKFSHEIITAYAGNAYVEEAGQE